MGRILRIATLAENDPKVIDCSTPDGRNGKLFISNTGSNNVLVGYDRSDVLAATASNFFTIESGILLILDLSSTVGYLSETQSLWFSATGGASTLEVWVAY